MAIGAAHAGVRAMTASSGGGFCLMVEALGLAGMTETPLVIAEVQRAGPSTGLPTRTEQSDLEFVLYASHGEFPRIVMAPGTIEQCFEAGHRAFNLAEKYQTPVIILSDLYLSNAVRTVDMDAIDFKPGPDRPRRAAGLRGAGPARRRLRPPPGDRDGISPRAIARPPERRLHHDRRRAHRRTASSPRSPTTASSRWTSGCASWSRAARGDAPAHLVRPEEADITLVGWGSTYGALREADRPAERRRATRRTCSSSWTSSRWTRTASRAELDKIRR